MRGTLSFLAFVFVLLLSCQEEKTDQATQQWKDLFDGSTLDGWVQLGGVAEYSVEDGCIVGRTVPNTPNSFMTTTEKFDDFILEFEVWVDSTVNSGVQVRSNSFKDYNNGRVHGYQVELDPSPRAFSGGIYDEGRRGWLYPLSRNEKGRRAFKNGEWNKVHVEAIGTSIKTWINDIQCANLVDDLTRVGFIGLQVHGIGNPEDAGKEMKWKNIRICTEDLSLFKRESDPEVVEVSYLLNELTENEKSNGWKLLWDGKTSKGWTGVNSPHFPETNWDIREGVLTFYPGKSGSNQDIITEELFSNFELDLEFNIAEKGNSGIKYFVDPEWMTETGEAIGLEYQVLDDKRHPDAKDGKGGNRTVAALYDLIPPKNLSIPGRGKQFKGVDAWNHARIVSKDGNVEHWLNHEKVLEYNRFEQPFKILIGLSKYSGYPNFAQIEKGHILLQDHGDIVSFRNIKIREL